MFKLISHFLKVMFVVTILAPAAMSQESGFSVTGIVGDPPTNPGGGWTNLGDWQNADALGFTLEQSNQYYSCQEVDPNNNYNPECNFQEGEDCATLSASECVPIVDTADECEEAGFTDYQAYKNGAELKGYLCTTLDYSDYAEATSISPAPAFSHWCQGNSCGNEMADDYRDLRTKWNGAAANNSLCQDKYTKDCQDLTLTLAEYDIVLDEVNECADYPTYAICLAAVDLGYEKTPADADLFEEATDNIYSAWCGANCNTLTKTAYNGVKALPAFQQEYTFLATDYDLWTQANDGNENAQCAIEFPSQTCAQLDKSEYQLVLANINQCSGYLNYTACKDATSTAKGYSFSEHALYAEAQGTTYDGYCNDVAGQNCSELSRTDFVSAKSYSLNCVSFVDFAECQAAEDNGYALTAEDAALYQTALADSGNNQLCITTGAFAADTANACGQLSKTQYSDMLASITAANTALADAINNATNAGLITVETIKLSDAYTNFANNGTACSTVPTDTDLTDNLERFKYFMSKANFSSDAANVSKQLCYATLAHTELTWHNDAPNDYIIAAENVVGSSTDITTPDFKRCGFWSKRTAISKVSTNQMKSASNTIIYDVRAQDDTLAFTEPTISSDKGHAVLSYTVAGQDTVTNASMTLSVLGRAPDGIITASASDKVVSVNVEEKAVTTDAIYNVFQKTASSSTWRLRNAINDNPGSACPSGYSMIKTTNNGTLNTMKAIALKHGTGAGTMPSGHRMEQCANQFLECNAGFSACSNPNGSNWRMRLMIYGEKSGQTCGVTRKKAPGNTFHPDKTDWPNGFSMYSDTGQCSDVGTYSGQPRLANGCVGWCWVRVLCRKDGSEHVVWQ